MTAAVRRLWRWVRPSGRLAITTWGPRVFEPANSVFWEAVRAVRPELYKSFNPWDRISTPEVVVTLMSEAGVTNATAKAEEGMHPLQTPEDWWTIVRGSGYRGVIDKLSTSEQESVRTRVLREVSARGIERVETNVVYALARKAELAAR